MRSVLFIHCAILLSINAISQDFSLKYKFETVPDVSFAQKDYNLSKTDELVILDERTIEFAYEANKKLFQYLYIHNIIYVNSEDAVNRNNKVYIPVQDTNNVIDIDCRVILNNGEKRKLEKSSVIQAVNENGQNVFYFAVFGAEKESYIEYYYLIRQDARISGTYFNLQSNFPIARSVFKIISPNHLFFATKSFNGYSNFDADTTLIGHNYLVAITNNIPKIQQEDFANIGGNKMKVEYHLFRNTENGVRNYYNYGRASQNIFENLSQPISKNANNELEKILKACDINDVAGTTEKLFRIENFVKSKFKYYDDKDDRLNNIDFILKNKAFNNYGSALLFYHLLATAEIESEIVLTSDRFENKFDMEYESWSFLQTYLFYFPEINMFLCPNAMYFRLGLIPYGFIGNYGLFIKKTSVAGIETGIGKIKEIPQNPADLSLSVIKISAELNPEPDSLLVDFTNIFTGYYAQGYQTVYDFMPQENIDEFEQNFVKQICNNTKIKSIEIENKGSENLMLKPFIVRSVFTTSQIIDKAGKKIIIKIGDLIGLQKELYQENERSLPVENAFNRKYMRELILILPENHTLKNIDKLNISVQPFLNSGDLAGFVSRYTLDQNKLTISLNEYYNELVFGIDQFMQFREVVNAAADFNKIMLILEPLDNQ